MSCNPCYYGKHIQCDYQANKYESSCNPCYYGKHIQ